MLFKSYYINKFFDLNQAPENQILGISTHGNCLDCGKEVNPAEYNHVGNIGYLYDPWYRENELPYVAKVWNSKCEAEIIEEFKQNFIDSPKYDRLTEIAKKYLTDMQIEWLESNFRKTHSSIKQVEGALHRFIHARLNQLEIVPNYIFRVRECINCGRHFGEREVWRKAYLGGIFDTCQDCCNMAVFDLVDRYMEYLVEKDRAEHVKRQSKSKAEMLKDVKILIDLLENIPPVSSDYSRIFLHPKFSKKRRREIIKHLYFMERPYFYKKVFRTWFHALVEAGVLDKDARRVGRGTMCLAQDKHLCRSLAEKMIDDWLYAHGIPHKVEPLYPNHKIYNPNKRLRGDWLIGDVFVEFLGLMEDNKYREKIEKKKMIAEENDIRLILIEPHHLASLESILCKTIVNARRGE